MKALDYICPECQACVMQPHPENKKYEKCSVCGFTRKVNKKPETE